MADRPIPREQWTDDEARKADQLASIGLPVPGEPIARDKADVLEV